MMLCAVVFFLVACTGSLQPQQRTWQLNTMVSAVQKSVVTVAGFDIDGDLFVIGSGFFIDPEGTLVTNYHVLDGAYKGVVKTSDGGKYAIKEVIARNPLLDLIKVRVEIPPEQVVPVVLSEDEPAVAERVVVIGSPMGFDQTISEGIVSAVRAHPAGGKVYQLTAPISQGSSGGPALNLKGEVIGVVTFQASKGQNLNFAVSAKILQTLSNETDELTLAEWTLRKSGADPKLAASLCRRGTTLSFEGKYQEALDYFQQATETNPSDPEAWHGLGSCYVGLDQLDDAVDAYQNSIEADPESASSHFLLAMFYKSMKQYFRAISSLSNVISIAPRNIQARLELADAYGKLDQTDAQLESFREILEIKPDHVPTLHRMGQVVGQIGRYDEALALLLKASTLAPENAGIYFDIGVTYHYQRLPEEELRAYTQAIRADPRMTSAHHNLGLLFINQGNQKLALQQYAILKDLDAEKAETLFGQIYPETLKAVSDSNQTD